MSTYNYNDFACGCDMCRTGGPMPTYSSTSFTVAPVINQDVLKLQSILIELLQYMQFETSRQRFLAPEVIESLLIRVRKL